jgi:hypothetical protein
MKVVIGPERFSFHFNDNFVFRDLELLILKLLPLGGLFSHFDLTGLNQCP